jgi:hypothetical protein
LLSDASKGASKEVGDKQEAIAYANASYLSPTPFIFYFGAWHDAFFLSIVFVHKMTLLSLLSDIILNDYFYYSESCVGPTQIHRRVIRAAGDRTMHRSAFRSTRTAPRWLYPRR